MNYYYTYNSPIGLLRIEADEQAIIGIKIIQQDEPQMGYESDLIRSTYQQIQQYFEGTRTQFTIPIRLEGTPFQQKVWSALQTIPYGETRTYGEIAKMIGNPKACRAVGGANNKNPILILVPCHRVIGSNGALVGFAAGMNVKQMLLLRETGQAISF